MKKLAETSGQLVDWHFVGGRVRVCAAKAADMGLVRWALKLHMEEHDELREREAQQYGHSCQFHPRPEWWNDADQVPLLQGTRSKE